MGEAAPHALPGPEGHWLNEDTEASVGLLLFAMLHTSLLADGVETLWKILLLMSVPTSQRSAYRGSCTSSDPQAKTGSGCNYGDSVRLWDPCCKASLKHGSDEDRRLKRSQDSPSILPRWSS